MDYDVFLCCSSEDHDPHAIRIVRLIESNGYRVCYHERDFRPGSLITDNIGQSIERSKRSMLDIKQLPAKVMLFFMRKVLSIHKPLCIYY